MSSLRRRHSPAADHFPAPLAALTIQPPAWTVDALCAQMNPEVFFPPKGGDTELAKAVCRRCDVISDCLTYALEHDEPFGVWGGLSVVQRRRLTRRRRRGVA